jgi:hypothetical protein
MTTGENDACQPWRAEWARMVCRANTFRSAACTGPTAGREISSCPGEYSGWNWPTRTPDVLRAVISPLA